MEENWTAQAVEIAGRNRGPRTLRIACHTATRVRFCQECGEQFVSPGNKKRCVQCEYDVKRARENAARRPQRETKSCA